MHSTIGATPHPSSHVINDDRIVVRVSFHLTLNHSVLHVFLQILMTVRVIPARTTEPVMTKLTDITAAVNQGFMECNVKKAQVNIVK